ncbi:aldehyde dehydrogenase family protein [Bifidobacterium platyrrhinorum]|uniref:Aldehyde dehydrogenase n=1 Tax=Bifidobacterium platyrrhinorum TaxID=2661628 RepID=A0A6L9SP34_9BIFI|nr:aldehyde dehydrogenase family protein [Bifidobacterium platyrrhinorum]NEG54270.1 aldehyde dehydrogenase family protein [Bifidobacterium platyrrhinorum]
MTDDTFRRLNTTFESGRTRPLAWRRAQLDALRRMMRERGDDLAEAVHADLGKPVAETTLTELDLIAAEARFVRDRMGSWARRRPVAMPWALQPALGWTVAEPKGVVLVIAPWNYPVLLSLGPMADALAAGNAVCLKPSELAPRTSALLARLVPRYLDPDAVAVVEGGAKETGALLARPFDHVFYTGGERVGRIVMAAAAKHPTPVTLELGGKSPCFVDGTCDLGVAARRIAWGRFTNAGQTCVAPDYVLATPDVAEALAERIGVAVREFYGEDPRRSPDYGRIVNGRHVDRLCGLLPVRAASGDGASGPRGTHVLRRDLREPLVKAASAIGAVIDMAGRRLSRGAVVPAGDGPGSGTADGIVAVPGVADPAGRVVCGGVVDREARYVAPTVLFGTSPDAPVMREEIFGPILPVLVVRDADEAIRFVNARPRPLAAYVFSRDRATRLAFERRTSSGALGFGLPLGHLMSARLPFGGVGASGIGAYHGKSGFNAFSHVKTVTVKPSHPDTLRLVYPPFDAMTRRVIDVLRRLG